MRKTKKIQKLTKEQRLKGKIKELEQINLSLKSENLDVVGEREYWKGKYDMLKETGDKYLSSIEGRESHALREVQWLRDTLQLVIVPKGREDELAKVIER